MDSRIRSNFTAYVDVEAEPEQIDEKQLNSDLVHIINGLYNLNRTFSLPHDYYSYNLGSKTALAREMVGWLGRQGAFTSTPDGIANVPKSRPMPVAIKGKDTPREELLRSIFGKTGSGVYLDETLK